ncbi:Abi family protein [Plantibacter sp. CFBP 13570]|uniref:Abi family protein n=1 Tax=Plantibacter sp. CFBP 13570 TaxID=2775272 RepID=UPI001930C63E|nr:Abi family protein [Plantibacter sp. CFBP 13570]MBD8535675.1 Abi family protein [Plantibacter sp. CFBP 13570]
MSIEQQITQLQGRGLVVDDRAAATQLLDEVGYYRLTGYLYPARQSERFVDESGRCRTRVLSAYRPGTHIDHAAALITFDRDLRLHVLEAVERIEVSLRTQVGHILGQRSAFAHLEQRNLTPAFVQPYVDEETGETTSKHAEWITRVDERRASSKEAFVAHFREKYDDQMPIWALTEILELGHLAKLYSGLQNDIATRVATHYAVPSKTTLASWIASTNYVRNVAAHQARLFNRKLVVAPTRPRGNTVPLLAHLRDDSAPKQDFGLYNALAVMAYLLRSVSGHTEWTSRLREIVDGFPNVPFLGIESMGFAEGWNHAELWN